MTERQKRYLQDDLKGWRRSNFWEASQIFLRTFALVNIPLVALGMFFKNPIDFAGAFRIALICAVLAAPISMIFKVRPVFDK